MLHSITWVVSLFTALLIPISLVAVAILGMDYFVTVSMASIAVGGTSMYLLEHLHG